MAYSEQSQTGFNIMDLNLDQWLLIVNLLKREKLRAENNARLYETIRAELTGQSISPHEFNEPCIEANIIYQQIRHL